LLTGLDRFEVLLVEDKECPQADVGDLFLVERDPAPRYWCFVLERYVGYRPNGRRRCATRQRQGYADGSQHWYDFFPTGSLRRLLRTWHVGPPMPFQEMFVARIIGTPRIGHPQGGSGTRPTNAHRVLITAC
jgi:hypothetical protein